jgi:membrane fusion protein (multidrug efflux system)
MKKRNIIIIIIIVIIITIIVIIPKSKKDDGIPKNKLGFDKSKASTTFTVKSEMVKEKSLQSYIKINGDVESDTKVEVYPDVGGKISRVLVNLGSWINKGQLIAEVDPSKPGETYNINPVYAPISGAITSVPVCVGSTVTTNSAIVIISVIDDLQINTKISERYVSLLKIGLKATITFEAYPGINFSASISRISPFVDSISRTKQIYLVFDKKDDRINTGMFAKIKLDTVKYENILTAPEDSIITNLNENYLFVLQDDMTVSKRIIEKGITVDGITEIISGLKSGEKIVIQGMRMLSDGASVKDITDSGAKK